MTLSPVSSVITVCVLTGDWSAMMVAMHGLMKPVAKAKRRKDIVKGARACPELMMEGIAAELIPKKTWSMLIMVIGICWAHR